MEFVDTVRDTARSLGLLEADGTLSQLDSLSILDLVTKLEESTQLTLPTNEVVPEHFQTIETVAEFLATIKARSR